jgi:hypothetical protein
MIRKLGNQKNLVDFHCENYFDWKKFIAKRNGRHPNASIILVGQVDFDNLIDVWTRCDQKSWLLK